MMINRDKDFRKGIIKQFYRDNEKISVEFIAQATDKSPKTVQSWLYEKVNAPSVGDLILIDRCFGHMRGINRKALEPLRDMLRNHVNKTKEALRLAGSSMDFIFIYEGKEVTKSWLAEHFKVHMNTIISLLHGVEHEEDITDLINSQITARQNRARQAPTYLFNSERHSVTEIARRANLDTNKLRYFIKKHSISPDDDLTDIAARIEEDKQKKADQKKSNQQKSHLEQSEYNRVYNYIRKLKSKNISISVKNILDKARQEGFAQGDFDVIIEDRNEVTLEHVQIIPRQKYFLNGKPTTLNELASEVGSSISRVNNYLHKMEIERGTNVNIETMKQYFDKQEMERKYLYRGEWLSQAEIAKKSGRSHSALRRPFNLFQPGDDVTEYIDSMSTRNRGATYIYKGKKLTKKELSEMVKLKYNTLVATFHRHNIQPNEDVTRLF